jgi:hypothetical protein
MACCGMPLVLEASARRFFLFVDDVFFVPKKFKPAEVRRAGGGGPLQPKFYAQPT